MNTALWILLGLTVWSLCSLPLGLVVGRALRQADPSRPGPRGRATTVLAA